MTMTAGEHIIDELRESPTLALLMHRLCKQHAEFLDSRAGIAISGASARAHRAEVRNLSKLFARLTSESDHILASLLKGET